MKTATPAEHRDGITLSEVKSTAPLTIPRNCGGHQPIPDCTITSVTFAPPPPSRQHSEVAYLLHDLLH